MPPPLLRSSIDYNAIRKQLPGLAASATVEQLSELEREGLEGLRDDISNTMILRGPEAAARIVPPGKLRERIRELGTTTNKAQQTAGGLGAVGGGVLGAGVGAVAMGLSKGRKYAPLGLITGLPGAAVGYGVGKDAVTRRQVLETLAEEMGPGAGIKQANIEPGFKEILRELHEKKVKGNLPMSDFSGAIRDLQLGRGRKLTPPERLVLRKVILGRDDLPKAVFNKLKGRRGVTPVAVPAPWFKPKAGDKFHNLRAHLNKNAPRGANAPDAYQSLRDWLKKHDTTKKTTGLPNRPARASRGGAKAADPRMNSFFQKVRNKRTGIKAPAVKPPFKMTAAKVLGITAGGAAALALLGLAASKLPRFKSDPLNDNAFYNDPIEDESLNDEPLRY